MSVGKLLITGGTALALTLTACGADSPTASTSTSARPALCAALGELGKSIRAVDDADSMSEFRAQVEAARDDYDAVREEAAGAYSVQAGELDAALANVEGGSQASRAETAAKLAQGYERLDAAVSCP